MSPASTSGATSLIVISLIVLLALSLAAIIRTPPWTPSALEQEPGSQPGKPESAIEPPTAPLPRRVAGESGRVAREPGEPTDLSGLIRRPGVWGGPPWDPAPRPPGMR